AAPPAPPAKASGKTKAPEGNAETKTAEEAEEARAAEEEVVEEEGVPETEGETEVEEEGEGEVETEAVVETEAELEAEAVAETGAEVDLEVEAETRSAGADSVKTAPSRTPSNEAFGNAPNLHEPDGAMARGGCSSESEFWKVSPASWAAAAVSRASPAAASRTAATATMANHKYIPKGMKNLRHKSMAEAERGNKARAGVGMDWESG
ncbi:MAG: hypothetical protein LBG65_08395, partial [Puniceicoccales bacterium]|nr:hypothetical protein [Puniceicoccales bacterium]